MSKKATEFQRKAMSRMYRGKEIFKPLNTGWIDENVACVREWVANIFFYRKGDKGYAFTYKVFPNMGHGTLAGEHPELFSKEVQAAHRHSLAR